METVAGKQGSNICRSCLSTGSSCTSGVSWGHRRVTLLWAGAAGTSGGAMRELSSRTGAGSVSKGVQDPSDCTEPFPVLFCYKTTSGGRAWAGLYSQDLRLVPGVPSCTEEHPGWECNHMSRQGWRGRVLTERSSDFKIEF